MRHSDLQTWENRPLLNSLLIVRRKRVIICKGGARFVLSHPFRKGRAKDGAPWRSLLTGRHFVGYRFVAHWRLKQGRIWLVPIKRNQILLSFAQFAGRRIFRT